MKLAEFLNEISKRGDQLQTTDVLTLLSKLNQSGNVWLKEMEQGDPEKATKHLISNTENFTCFFCSIPPRVKSEKIVSDYDSISLLVAEGKAYLEKEKGQLTSSFGKTSRTEMVVLKQGELHSLRLNPGAFTMSNPFDEHTGILCIHLKDHENLNKEVSHLVEAYDSINGIKV